jgi:hypothetical protein
MGRFIAGVVAVAGIILIAQMWPDVSRYMRMRSM